MQQFLKIEDLVVLVVYTKRFFAIRVFEHNIELGRLIARFHYGEGELSHCRLEQLFQIRNAKLWFVNAYEKGCRFIRVTIRFSEETSKDCLRGDR